MIHESQLDEALSQELVIHKASLHHAIIEDLCQYVVHCKQDMCWSDQTLAPRSNRAQQAPQRWRKPRVFVRGRVAT